MLNSNAEIMKKYPTWVITIEGHCRRARHCRIQPGARRAAGAGGAQLPGLARHPADRLRTVSYGKEFPFDPGHDEAAFAKNRRAHFVVTSK